MRHPEFKAPRRIWLQPFDEDGEPNDAEGGITWSQDKVHDTDIEYLLSEQPPKA